MPAGVLIHRSPQAKVWGVKAITHNLLRKAYLCRVALSVGPGQHFSNIVAWRNAMLSFDSYREVLSEHARGRHLIWSAWIVAAALAALVIILA
jgi:hypothetical protein